MQRPEVYESGWRKWPKEVAEVAEGNGRRKWPKEVAEVAEMAGVAKALGTKSAEEI